MLPAWDTWTHVIAVMHAGKAYLSDVEIMHGHKSQDGHKGHRGLPAHGVSTGQVSSDGGGVWLAKGRAACMVHQGSLPFRMAGFMVI